MTPFTWRNNIGDHELVWTLVHIMGLPIRTHRPLPQSWYSSPLQSPCQAAAPAVPHRYAITTGKADFSNKAGIDLSEDLSIDWM